MAFDLMRGFQVGQGIAGTSAFGNFVSQLTERAKGIFDQRLETQGEVEAQRQLLPLKEESELRLHQAKAQTDRESASQMFQQMTGLTGAGGGAFPPGTTMSSDFGGVKVSVPLNREFTAEESQVVSKAPAVREEVEKAKKLVSATGFGTQVLSGIPGIGLAAQVSGSKGLARGEALRQIPNNLKVIFGFTLGGKTFSPTEQKAIMRLIDPRGKSDPQASEDLEKAAKLSEYAAALIQNGQASSKTWKEVMAEVGISVEAFEERLGLPNTPPTGTKDSGVPEDLRARAVEALQRRRAR